MARKTATADESRDANPAQNGAVLYLVWHEGGAALAPSDLDEFGDAFALADDVLLVLTRQSRSRLYHAAKRRARPERLLVAPLADVPKFKGMADGALKWVRSL